MSARSLRIAATLLFVASMSFPASAVAKDIKLTGVIKSLARGTNQQHCGGSSGARMYAKTLVLRKGKKQVGTLTFTQCQSPGTQTSFSGTGHISVGKITGAVQVHVAFSAQPSFVHGYNGGEIFKNSQSTTEELFYVTGSGARQLPNTVGAQIQIVLTTKLVSR